MWTVDTVFAWEFLYYVITNYKIDVTYLCTISDISNNTLITIKSMNFHKTHDVPEKIEFILIKYKLLWLEAK